jgi:hypothetical protein
LEREGKKIARSLPFFPLPPPPPFFFFFFFFFFMASASQVALVDTDEVPRMAPGAGKLDAPTLLRALLAQDFGAVVDMATFEVHNSIDMRTMFMMPAFASVKLLANKDQHLSLWYNADDSMANKS